MKRQKTEIIITIVLVIIFFIFLYSTLVKRTRGIIKQGAEETAGVKVVENKIERLASHKGLGWGRDPFSKMPKGKPIEGKVFVLTACVWDSENPLAIINGNVVCAGQEVDGYTVIKIDKDNVVLKKGPEEITLELYK